MSSEYSQVTSLQIKRIEKELKQLHENPPEKFRAFPVKNNLFEWHFTMQGPEGSDFEQGIYHGKIELPSEYPIKPPNIYFLTPNGRFQLKTKICLNITKFHPENWNPSWTIRTMIEGIIHHFIVKEAFMAVGSLDYTSNQIKKLALDSHKWVCEDCGSIAEIIQPYKKAEVEGKDKVKKEQENNPIEKQEEKVEDQKNNLNNEKENVDQDEEDDEEEEENIIPNQKPQGKDKSKKEGIIQAQILETQQKFENVKQKIIKNRLTHEDMRIFNLIINHNQAEMIAIKSIKLISQKEQSEEKQNSQEQIISTGSAIIDEMKSVQKVVTAAEEDVLFLQLNFYKKRIFRLRIIEDKINQRIVIQCFF